MGKASRRQRGTEQGREERSHAADGGGAAVVVLEPQQGAKVPADAAAHLQGSALAAGRAAAQVGEHRAQKDGGHQQRADRLAALHGADNVVGAHTLALGHLIKGSDEQTRHRQKEQQPGLRGAQFCRVLDGKVEQGAQKSAEQTHGNRQKEPLQRHPDGGFGFVPECIKIVHRHKLLYIDIRSVFWNRYKITPQGRAVNPKMGRATGINFPTEGFPRSGEAVTAGD